MRRRCLRVVSLVCFDSLSIARHAYLDEDEERAKSKAEREMAVEQRASIENWGQTSEKDKAKKQSSTARPTCTSFRSSDPFSALRLRLSIPRAAA